VLWKVVAGSSGNWDEFSWVSGVKLSVESGRSGTGVRPSRFEGLD